MRKVRLPYANNNLQWTKCTCLGVGDSESYNTNKIIKYILIE